MNVLINQPNPPSSWIRNEIELQKTLAKGSKGNAVKRTQEWLNLHNIGLVIDSDFGPVTESKVKEFQKIKGLPVTGVVDTVTFNELVSPLLHILTPLDTNGMNHSYPGLVREYANLHLAEHPREVGGQNCGPWVRLYMEGREGAQWAWCAGFVTFILKQAAEVLQIKPPIKGSFSCDVLASQAQNIGRFVNNSTDLRNNPNQTDTSIFLNRRTSTDWTHTGIVTQFNQNSFETIEGNTNDDGNREGYEVCTLTRGYSNKDFILI